MVHPLHQIVMNEVSGPVRPPDGHKAQIVRQEGGGCLKAKRPPKSVVDSLLAGIWLT